MIKEIVSTLTLSALTFGAFSDNAVTINSGFITGYTFRILPTTDKNVYATGLVDGMLLAPLYGAPEVNLEWFQSCTTGMTGQQIVAILEKYLNEHPERWHNSMHVISYSAFKSICYK